MVESLAMYNLKDMHTSQNFLSCVYKKVKENSKIRDLNLHNWVTQLYIVLQMYLVFHSSESAVFSELFFIVFKLSEKVNYVKMNY